MSNKSKIWYFTYGNGMDKSRLERNNIKVFDSKVATLRGFNLSFNRKGDNAMIMDSNLSYDPHNFVEGIAHQINEEDIKKIDKLEKHPTGSTKRLLSISFRGDKQDQPMKEAYVYNKDVPTRSLSGYKIGSGQGGGMMKFRSGNRTFKIEPKQSGGLGKTFVAAFESYSYLYKNNRLNELNFYEENIENEDTERIKKTIENLLKKDVAGKNKNIFDNVSSTLFDDILELERRDELPSKLINDFITWLNKLYSYNAPMSWFVPENFTTLTSFFSRKLAPEKLEDCIKMAEPAIVCSPGEGSLVSTGYIDKNIHIKNVYADLETGAKEIGIDIEDYIFINFKLYKSYYHRAHSPVDGKITKIIDLKPFETNFFGKNSTIVLEIETSFGKIYMLIVGELNIQAFTLTVKKGDNIKKCDELGYFNYGSQIILLVPKDMEGNNNMRVDRTYFVGSPLIINNK